MKHLARNFLTMHISHDDLLVVRTSQKIESVHGEANSAALARVWSETLDAP